MRLRPESSSLGRWLALPALVLAAAGLALARWQPGIVDALSHCRFRELTGLACPTCGGTGAALALADGRWLDAAAANPAVPLVALLLLLWGAWALAAAAAPVLRVRPALGPRETRAARLLAALLLLGLWARQLALPH